MIKKLFLILPFFIFGIIALYFFDITSLVYTVLWNNEYKKGEYEKAIIYHEKAYDLTNDSILKYNIALDNYKLKEYERSEKLLTEMDDSQNPKIEAKKYFSLWNTLYFLWEKDSNTEETIKKWEKSLSYFQRSFDYKKSKEAEENYIYVEEKLKKLKEEQQKQKENQNKEEKSDEWEDTSEKQNKDEPKKEDQKTGEEEQSNEKKGGEIWSSSQGWQAWNNLESITEDEKKYLEWYAEYLEEKQKQNQQFFNNGSSWNGFNDIFDSFFNNPMFSNELPGNEEKDW